MALTGRALGYSLTGNKLQDEENFMDRRKFITTAGAAGTAAAAATVAAPAIAASSREMTIVSSWPGISPALVLVLNGWRHELQR